MCIRDRAVEMKFLKGTQGCLDVYKRQYDVRRDLAKCMTRFSRSSTLTMESVKFSRSVNDTFTAELCNLFECIEAAMLFTDIL